MSAFIFDMNGTMIDDMEFHIRSWHKILTGLGAELTMEEVKLQCYGKNDELLERIFPGRFNEAEMRKMGLDKETEYQASFRPSLKLIDGLDAFLEKTKQHGIAMAIGSAAIMFNIDFVLDGLALRDNFKAIVSADDVAVSKPDPEVFLRCAALLGVDAGDCIVFEDSPKGVEAAKNAGMRCVAITTMHTEDEFTDRDNIICFIEDYNDPQLNNLFS